MSELFWLNDKQWAKLEPLLPPYTPDHCHRRLVAEYLRNKWGDVEITHL